MNIVIEILATDPRDQIQKALTFSGGSGRISLESRGFVGQFGRSEQECPESPVFDRSSIVSYVDEYGDKWIYGRRKTLFGYGAPKAFPPFPLDIFNEYGNQKTMCQAHMVQAMLNVLDGFRINRNFDHIMACAEVLERGIPRLFSVMINRLWFLSNYDPMPIQEILDLVHSGHLWSVSFERDSPERQRIDRIFIPFFPPSELAFLPETRESSREYWRKLLESTTVDRRN